jgi:ubiquitin-conjugating enzyme E2 Z
MTSFCIKRIMTDIASIQKDPIDKEKIFIYQNPENIFSVRVLMIGDEDTPYQYGMFYFYLVFPDNYPFSPPDMKFITSNGKTRFNPNLYISGKVCISLLNTWQGPKWTACNSLRSLLLSIKSMILGIKYPLENEPGFEITLEKKKNIDSSTIYYKYNTIIEYQVIFHTIIKQYIEPPVGMEVFAPIVSRYLEDNIHSIRNKIIESLSKNVYNKNYIFINYQNQSQYIDYETLLDYFDKTFAHYLNKNSEPPIKTVNSVVDLTQNSDINNSSINSKVDLTQNSDINNSSKNDNIPSELFTDNKFQDLNYKYNDSTYNNVIELITPKEIQEEQNFKMSEHNNLTVSLNNKSIIQMQIDSNNFIQQNVSFNKQDESYNYFESQEKISIDNVIADNNTDSDVEFICVIPSNNGIVSVKIEKDCVNVKIADAKPLLDDVSMKLDENDNYDSDEPTNKVSSKSKKCPGKSAKNYEDGTIMISENDNRKYIVKSYIKKNYSKGNIMSVNVKRWTLFKK